MIRKLYIFLKLCYLHFEVGRLRARQLNHTRRQDLDKQPTVYN